MFKLIVTGLALGTLAATSALAADLTLPQTPEPSYSAPEMMSQPNDWTGFYVGVLGGYGFGNTDTTGGSTSSIQTNGVLGGVTVGGNYQIDSFVLGIEGDVGWSGQSGSATCAAGTCSADYDWIGSVRGRAGYAIDPVLLYATGGVAVARVNTSVSPVAPGTTGSYSDTFTGWTIGAGAEAALTEQLSAKIEYSYSDFGDQTAPANTLAAGATTVSPTSHAIKVGLNYRF
jgi:outer membrane immunogenic protein